MSSQNDQKPSSPFLTTEEAAEFLRVEPRTMDNWRWSGGGPKFRKHGGRVVYHVKELIRYSETRHGYHGG